MKTTLSERGQTAVPAVIREKFGMKPGQQIEWVEDGKAIHLLPVPENPIKHFRGSSRGLTSALLSHRKKERARERGSRP